MTPHFLIGSGGLSVVNWQTSIALTRSSPVTLANAAVALHAGVGAVSSVVGSQSSSTPLPGYSKAPGLTRNGTAQVGPATSQQSPCAGVHPSPS